MTAERIASVVSNVYRGLYMVTPNLTHARHHEGGPLAEELPTWNEVAKDVVVDSTDLYRNLVARDEGIALYEDHECIAPPWVRSTICFENEHGNVVVMVGMAGAAGGRGQPASWGEQWDANPDCSWEDVHWVMTTLVFVGGRSKGQAVPTIGPSACFQYAIAADGTPLDIHWLDFVAAKSGSNTMPEEWDMALLVHLGTLNFMSARNIDIVEPKRSRPQQKRIARHGVRVHELRVFPTGRSSKTRGEGQPLTLASHGVRGHFAHYGACCPHHEPRGLLFGKLEGKFYVPQHVRGSKDVGEIKQEFVLLDDPEKGN